MRPPPRPIARPASPVGNSDAPMMIIAVYHGGERVWGWRNHGPGAARVGRAVEHVADIHPAQARRAAAGLRALPPPPTPAAPSPRGRSRKSLAAPDSAAATVTPAAVAKVATVTVSPPRPAKVGKGRLSRAAAAVQPVAGGRVDGALGARQTKRRRVPGGPEAAGDKQ